MDAVGKLGALDADIRRVQQRLARVATSGLPLLPPGLHRAMLPPDEQQPPLADGAREGSGSRKRPRTEEAAAADAPPAKGNGASNDLPSGLRGSFQHSPHPAEREKEILFASPAQGSSVSVGDGGETLCAVSRLERKGAGGELETRLQGVPCAGDRLLRTARGRGGRSRAAGGVPRACAAWGRSLAAAAAHAATSVPAAAAVFPSSDLGFTLEDYGGEVSGGVLGGEAADHLSEFSGDLSRFLRYSRLKVCCTLLDGLSAYCGSKGNRTCTGFTGNQHSRCSL